jgi:hypothetical protein
MSACKAVLRRHNPPFPPPPASSPCSLCLDHRDPLPQTPCPQELITAKLQVAELKEQQVMAQRQLTRHLSRSPSGAGRALSRTASAASAEAGGGGGGGGGGGSAPASRGATTSPAPRPPGGGRVFGAGGPFALLEQLAARANAANAGAA